MFLNGTRAEHRMVSGVFFDFWGTLVENGTYSPMKQTYKLLLVRMPLGAFAERFENVFMAKQYADQQEAFTAVCEDFGITPKPFLIEKLIGIWNKNRLLAQVYPETVEALKMLKEKGLKVAITSNAPNGAVEPVIERFDLDEYLDGVFISANEGKLKTTGLFDVALEQLGLEKDDVVVVGDSMETDIKGAKAAGLRAILIDRRDSRDYDDKITSLTELAEKLED